MYKLISVNLGQPTALQVGNRMTVTGINKHAVPGRVRVTQQGLEGDHVINRKHHGGPDQAVYVYTREDYDFWTELLGTPEDPGTFGENLLISGLESANLRVGDRLEIVGADGEAPVILEVTGPRIPCGTLGAQMEDAGFVKRFVKARRPGVYTRVVQGGLVGRGDNVNYQPAPQDAPTIGEMFDLWYQERPARQTLEALLNHPLAERFRAEVQARLTEQR